MDSDLYEHLNHTITSRQDIDQQSANTRSSVEVGPDGEMPSAADASRPRQRTMSGSLPEEIDQVVQAISSSQWASKLGTLMGSVKKQVRFVLFSDSDDAILERNRLRVN
jgi:hypothetical protein